MHCIPQYDECPGVIEQKSEIKKTMFHVFDISGQKSERRKWIHCFDMVTAVIFVASLSCYDEVNHYDDYVDFTNPLVVNHFIRKVHIDEHVPEDIQSLIAKFWGFGTVMSEDEENNSMVDSIDLFGSICHEESFKETAMILFLNKKNLFAEKIKTIPITECPYFQNYNGGPSDYDQTTGFIKAVFEEKDTTSKQIFTHLTCAVDKNQVEKVFNDIQTVIINASLAQGGLIA